MANTSPDLLAREILAACLEENRWRGRAFDALAVQCFAPDNAQKAGAALFGILVEALADRFDPRLCQLYTELFTELAGRAGLGWDTQELRSRYTRVRQPRKWSGDVAEVCVLSRVTLGADVVVTSVVLDALKQRFPQARLRLVGARKNYELFAADDRIDHILFEYPRASSVPERLASANTLQTLVDRPDTLVVDPDSRLTQLGLLPVCAEERYLFFESRCLGDDHAPLGDLTTEWVQQVFGISDVRPYIAPCGPVLDSEEVPSQPAITVSLGVGGNPAKRLSAEFEGELLRLLVRTGASILVDCGAGGEEAERAERAVAAAGAIPNQLMLWRGSFAGFSRQIARSRLYVGYDSAGQHVAAACSTPLLVVFAGEVCERMFQRWRPVGAGPTTVLRASKLDETELLRQAETAVRRALSLA